MGHASPILTADDGNDDAERSVGILPYSAGNFTSNLYTTRAGRYRTQISQGTVKDSLEGFYHSGRSQTAPVEILAPIYGEFW